MDGAGWKRYALVGVAIAAVLAVFAVLYGWLPWWIDGPRLRHLAAKDQTGALSSDRGDVLKMVAGAGALVALVYTARKHALDRRAHDLDRQAQELSRQVYALSEQGQVTDRYTKAITQLASDKLSERIGGIYALERVMADSARDHPTVVEVLAAFVRQHAPLPVTPKAESEAGAGPNESGVPVRVRPEADVQAAMTVLARRPERTEPFAVDLRRTALAGLELSARARLARANLAGADLTGAILGQATLTEANLGQATLAGAILGGADLAGANLGGADLTGAILGGATLIGAVLGGATLTEAFLAEADLARANLAGADLIGAVLGGATLIGAYLSEARLTGANLAKADLTGAFLGGARLTEADLAGADLTSAFLGGATLARADLGGATLTKVHGLGAWQLADAVVAGSTKVDTSLKQDAWVRARIEACKGWRRGNPAPPPTLEPPAASGTA